MHIVLICLPNINFGCYGNLNYHWLIMRECESYSNLKTTWTLFPLHDEDHIIPRTCSLDLAHLSRGGGGGGGLKSPPGMLHPLHFIKDLISQKPSDPHPLTMYILVPYAKTHPVTLARDSLGPFPTPFI